MELGSLIKKLGRKAPLAKSEPWDFPGYQDGPVDRSKEVRSVFLCLDLLPSCLDALSSSSFDLVLTHHPFFFGRKEEILDTFPWKKELHRCLWEQGLPVYSYHTCFDRAKGGMNDALIERLGLVPHESSDPYLRFADCDFRSLSELKERVRSAFGLPALLSLAAKEGPIRRIGVVGGGGSSMYPAALAAGCEVFLSGDSSHHARIEMREAGLSFLELPHECEETGFFLGMSRMLQEIDPTLRIVAPSLQKAMEV